MDLYETYVRTASGNTYHPEDIREGIKQFLSDDGYRISFNIEGVVITLRRETNISPDHAKLLREHLATEVIDACVTIRGHAAPGA